MFLSSSDLNLDAATLDATADKKNLSYILKFELLLSIAQYINSCLIFNNNHINNSITALEIKLNS